MTARLPIRWRLTVWYAALLAAVLLLFGGGLYLVLRQRLHAGFDEQLRNQAAVTLAAVRVEGLAPVLDMGAFDERDGEFFVRLVAADGRVVAETDGEHGAVPLERGAVAAALGGRGRLESARNDDETYRVVTVPVRQGSGEGSVVGVLQVGLDRDEIDEALTALMATLVLAGPAVLLAAAVGGYFLAGRALAPVATITGLAARIGGQDLDARLGLSLPDDELGRLARTFDAMLGRIEDAFERQRRFTGDAAHELRTPLSLMRAQVDLALARPRSAEAYREALAGLDADLDRLSGLVGTLLTLARADIGHLVLDRARFDLADTVALVLEQYAPVAEVAGVALAEEAGTSPIVADEDLLVQVLVNLIDNALASTPTGGVVTVGCGRCGDEARLWVADTGRGIAPEHQGRVFDRFYRVDVGRARAQGGTGLGLAICRAIAEAHGGTIGLASRVGRGTRVELALPAGVGGEPEGGAG